MYKVNCAIMFDMAEIPDIIKVPIVSNVWDALWSPLPDAVPSAAGTPMLVLTRPYEQGSATETQLHKMLQACGLNAAQCAIVMVEEQDSMSWAALKNRLQPKVVLLTGVHPQQLGVAALLQLNKPNNYSDTIWIPTLSIPELEQQPEAKKALWLEALKPVWVDNQYGVKAE